jgi:hypothetical protein
VAFAKGSFKATRELYGKTGGNEGHVVIQSFKPGEVTLCDYEYGLYPYAYKLLLDDVVLSSRLIPFQVDYM